MHFEDDEDTPASREMSIAIDVMASKEEMGVSSQGEEVEEEVEEEKEAEEDEEEVYETWKGKERQKNKASSFSTFQMF